MGIWSFFADRERKAELRESKDEMAVGEIVRAMAHRGWPSIGFFANNDFQRVRFKTIGDATFYSLYVTLNRLTGTGAISSAIVGSKATLRVTGEVRNFLADPDDLVNMYRTDIANLFKLSWTDVKVNHEYNSILGTTTQMVELDDFIGRGPQGVQHLSQIIDTELTRVRDRLAPYKRPDIS